MFLKKLSQEFFSKSPFLNLDLQKARIFLENPHKEVNVPLPASLFCSACFPFLGLFLMVGFFKKFSYFIILKKWCFCKKFLAQFSYKQCFRDKFKVANNLLKCFLAIFSQS